MRTRLINLSYFLITYKNIEIMKKFIYIILMLVAPWYLSAQTLTIGDDAVVTIGVGASANFGTVTSDAVTKLIIESDANGSGSLILEGSSAKATVERYIGQWSDADHGWHFLSSPVAAQPISVFHTAGSGNDFYKWDETNDEWINRTADGGGLNGSFEANFAVGTTGYLIANSTTTTKSFTGTLNTDDVSISGLTNTSSAFTYEGWHLLGNPYSSALEWNKTGGSWNLSGSIGSQCQIWKESSASYTVISANGIIPATNGFMVYTNANGGSLTIPKAARTDNNETNWYKNYTNNENRILLVAVDKEGKTEQESIIGFNDDATEGFDLEFDSYFISGFAPMFYSVEQNEYYALNTIPELNEETIIPMGFIKNINSTFKIELRENENDLPVYLTDKKTGSIQRLNDADYEFFSSDGDDPNRFEIRFGVVGLDDEPKITTQVWVNNGWLNVVKVEPGAQMEVFDLQGRKVFSKKIESNNARIQLSLPTGIYIARVMNTTAKVMIN